MNKDNNKNLIHNLEELFANFSNKRQIAVAVSGGCDSLALTLALNEFCLARKIKLFALTIDHLMRENSSIEAKKLGNILHQHKISHQIFSLDKNKLPTKNIEANLRQMRYEILFDFCKKNQIELLFLGHHLNDVAENFLIRLFRGSGLDGLSVVNKISKINDIFLIRPFLEIPKDDLKNYLMQKNIEWFEDESNEDEKFLRNKIRKFLDNLNNADFDKNIIAKRIFCASSEIENARDIIDEMMVSMEQKIVQKNAKNILLNRKLLRNLNQSIALKILSKILMELSSKNYKPRKEKLQRFYDYLIADGKIKKREFYQCVCEEFDENNVKIYLKTIQNSKT
ncbi:MAG: tRNA lysidine(34) synthetase TilS [Alphaproteobacteria bacterium]